MSKIKLMTHVVAGYPDMLKCEKLALLMAKAGVAFIEVQFPFSDPIADGPTIMEANEKALLSGSDPDACFALIKRLRNKIEIPILIMTYFNIPFTYGLQRFCRRAKKLGVYGLIIPDMPIDEEKYENYLKLCKKYDLHAIQIISPLTSSERLREIAQVASGFIYAVSTFGTTGTKNELNPNLKTYLAKVKKVTDIPLALGFGISSKEQVLEAANYADIVVIGSEIIELYKKSPRHKFAVLEDFLTEMLSFSR